MKRGKGPVLMLTWKQAEFLRAALLTHALVCVPATAARCNAILKKLPNQGNGPLHSSTAGKAD